MLSCVAASRHTVPTINECASARDARLAKSASRVGSGATSKKLIVLARHFRQRREKPLAFHEAKVDGGCGSDAPLGFRRANHICEERNYPTFLKNIGVPTP